MPIDYGTARAIAQHCIEQRCPPEWECVLLDDAVVETESLWIFFYQSARYFKTQNPGDRLPHNQPIVVDREYGRSYLIDKHGIIEDYLKPYEEAIQMAVNRFRESGR